MASFDAKLEKRDGASPLYVLSVSGRLDLTGVQVLEEQLKSIKPEPAPRVIFDLSRLGFIGSAGIGLFLSFVEQIRDAGGDARFINVPASVRAVLALLNVTEFLTEAGSQDSAVAELRG